MIHVRFRPAPDVPMVSVDIDERKHSIEAVLQHAAKRCGGQFNQQAEDESQARYLAVMAERARREKK